MGYVNISFKDIKRALIIIKLKSDIFPKLNDLINFSKDISKILESKLLDSCYTEFPSDINNNTRNYTLLFVLSTSHIAISTYFSTNEKYIDIEISWCSGANLDKDILLPIINKYFGDCEVYVKILDSHGNVIKEFN